MTAAGVVFAVDPALNSPGAAVFVRGELRCAANVYVDKRLRELDMGTRIDAVAQSCARWWDDWYSRAYPLFDGPDFLPLTFAYEKPTLRGGGPSSVDLDDVIHIAMVASAVAGYMRARRGGLIISAPTPEQWNHGSKKIKRNDPVIWQGQRGIQIASRLSGAERAVVPDCHDALDAVGIGLHALGRMEVRRVNARRRAP